MRPVLLFIKSEVEGHQRHLASGQVSYVRPYRTNKHPKHMTEAELKRERDHVDQHGSHLADEMIAAGRGHEKMSDTVKKDDELSKRYAAHLNRHRDIRDEED